MLKPSGKRTSRKQPKTMRDAQDQAAKAFVERVGRQSDRLERLLRNRGAVGDALEAVLLELSNATMVYVYDPSLARMFYLLAVLKSLASESARSHVDRILGDVETLLKPKTPRATVRAIEKRYAGFNLVEERKAVRHA